MEVLLWTTVAASIAAVGSLALNVVQFILRLRDRRELKAARSSHLLCTRPRALTTVERRVVQVQQASGDSFREESWIGITYLAELSITNRSERPNSVLSFELRISGVEPFGVATGIVCSCDAKRMTAPHPDFGDPLLVPLSLPAGVSTISGYVAFDSTFPIPGFDETKRRAMKFRY